MRITLVGSRHFGVTTFDMLRKHGVEIVRVVVADADDRLAPPARAPAAAGGGDTPPTPTPEQAARRSPPQNSEGSPTTRPCCRGTAASPRWNGRSAKAIRLQAA